jgi:uncharacterized protein (TIGR02996 family)
MAGSPFPPLPEAELRAFLAAIQDDPDDVAARLVFADWLEEHGDPRAELLRLGVALEPVRENPRERQAAILLRQLKAWQKQYLAAWLPKKTAGPSVQLDRGLMTWHINPRNWRTIISKPALRRLLDTGWVEWIDVRVWTSADWELVRADWPGLSGCTRLSLYRRWGVGGWLQTLGELPRVVALCAPTTTPCDTAELAVLGEMTELRDLQPPSARPEAFAALRGLPRLRRLAFSFDPALGDSHLKAVGPHPRLADLHLTGPENITDDGLSVLAGMPRLRRLYLGATRHVSRAGLEHVASLRELRHLDLSGSRNLRDDDLAALSGLTELRCLRFFGCEWLSDAGLEHLRPLIHMEELEVMNCPRVSTAAVSLLKRHWRQALPSRAQAR